ncbi:hypothetical protein CF327_g716 [Tilletia walkeri]|nr:hypothetical protein CF327_g716 [Tilletia walkeri]
MLQLSLALSSVSAAVLAIVAIYPYYQLKAFHFPTTPTLKNTHPDYPQPQQLQEPPLHPHLCEYIPELAHCDEIALHKHSGNAYFACDDTRLWRDPLRLLWEDEGTLPKSRKGGSIWHLDLNDAFSLPTRLDVLDSPDEGRGGFHPAGLTVTTTNVTQHNSSAPDSILLLVANYPQRASSGVVDVLVHDLRKSPTSLRHHRRLDSSHFHANWRGSTPSSATVDGRDKRVEDREVGDQLSPWRLSVFLEQWSPPLPADSPSSSSTKDIPIPSFFFSSAPSIPSNVSLISQHQGSGANFEHMALPSLKDYLLDFFLPSHSSRAHLAALKPPAHIYTYIANGAVSVPASDGTISVPIGAGLGAASSGKARALAGFPPIPRAWDGGGEISGRNNSASIVLVLGTQGSKSSVIEHEQHWVRPIGSLLRFFIQSPVYSAAKRLHFGGDGAVARWGDKEVVAVYTPQFVTFLSQTFGNLQMALANDLWGRFWTAGNVGGMDSARKWLMYLYAVSSGIPPSEDKTPGRPATIITQVTHLYRHGPSVAHPWELDRLKRPREAGMFLPKEFYPTPIFRSGASPITDGVGEWEPISIQPAAGSNGTEGGPRKVAKQLGFLPTLPTGLEVDHERGWVLVSSVWDERGAARCEIPKNWAEA